MLQENYYEGYEWGGAPLDPIGPVALNPQPLPPVDADRFEDAFDQFDDSMYF